MSQIRDMLFVNNLERRLRRPLTEDELNSDEPFAVNFPDGTREYIQVPRLQFPYDLLQNYVADIQEHEDSNEQDYDVQP